MLIARITLLVAGILALGPDVTSAAPTYLVQDLGTIDGTGGALATGLNNRGEVVGYGAAGGVREHAFLYDGAMHDLGTLGGFLQNSYAFGINDAGQVAGYSEIGGPPDPNGFAVYHGFIYSNGQLSDMGVLPGALDSQARAINNAGVATGWGSVRRNLEQTAILYSNGQLQRLVSTSDATTGYAINSAGWVAGIMGNVPFFYDGSVHPLTTPNFPGEAWGINDRGEVTGWADIGPNDAQRAFLYDGAMHDLGTLPGGDISYAFAINNRGDVVGNADTADRGTVFLYTDGRMYDLNSLLDPNPGYAIVQVRAINDKGQIAGSALIDRELHAVLLSPVPEPFSFAPLALAAPALFWRPSPTRS